MGDVLSLLASITLGLVTLVSGVMLGIALAFVLTAPLLDLLSQSTEARLREPRGGEPGPALRGGISP